MGWIEDFDRIAKENGLRFTFSPNCHSGIAVFISDSHRCGCWRCRKDRGEPWDDETEAQAEKDSAEAQRALRAWARATSGDSGDVDARLRGKDETMGGVRA